VLLALRCTMMVAMQTKVSVARLTKALRLCGRDLREFTPVALSRDSLAALALLNELGDPARLSDERYRLELAGDVATVVRLIIDRIKDDTCRRVGEAALAVHPDFYGMGVGERMLVLRGEGISEDVFKDRRLDVLPDVAVSVIRAFPGGVRRRLVVGICGDYDEPALDGSAEVFGRGLAERGVGVVSGYARAGLQVSLAMVNALEERGIVVDDERVIQYARETKDRLHPKGLVGRLIAYGQTQEQKRHRMLSACDVVVLFAGGDGTAAEARIAASYRIPVIPLGFTGGTAQQYWESELASAAPIMLGGYEVDRVLYTQLGHGHRDVAIHAGLALITQLMTASPVDSCDLPR